MPTSHLVVLGVMVNRGFALIAVVFLVKLVVNVVMRGPENWMERALPAVSMVGICYILAIITSRSSERLEKDRSMVENR